MEKAIKKYFPIFLLPTMIAFAIGFIVPFVYGIFLSFCKFTTVTDWKWKGLQNYSRIFFVNGKLDTTFIHCDGTYQRHQGYQSFPYRIFPAQPDWWYRTQLYLVNDF